MASSPSGRLIDHLHLRAVGHGCSRAFRRAALAAGGRDNGAPGDRHDPPGYYAAFAFDPDWSSLETVFHGSAGS